MSNSNQTLFSKSELRRLNIVELKANVEKESYIALQQYFNERGNPAEAKIACGVLSAIYRELQAINNARQLDIIEQRYKIEAPK